VRKWGSKGSGDSQFEAPTGIAVDRQDHVYVVDAVLERVAEFTSDGAFILKWEDEHDGGIGRVGGSSGIAVDSAGNVYIVDHSFGRVNKYGPSGKAQVGPIDNRAPALRNLRLTPRSFATRGKRRGTTIAFTVNERAELAMTFQRAASGRVVGKGRSKRCVKATRKLSKRTRCTRYVTVGRLDLFVSSSMTSIPFSGKVGRKRLPLGAGRVSVTATDDSGNRSKPATAKFVVRRR
jgi:DNA-binding beta-propeller fold protein YncE